MFATNITMRNHWNRSNEAQAHGAANERPPINGRR